MAKKSEIIANFESILKKQTSKNPLRLYSSSETPNKAKTEQRYSVEDVLANVCKQVKAIQNADVVSSKRVTILDKYKKKEFLTIDMLPVDKEVHQNKLTNFETQCVSDTQLINIIEDAEIIDKNRGVTQEFDTTFCQNSDDSDSGDDKKILNSQITDVNPNERHDIILDDVETNSSSLKVNKDDTSELDTLTCIECPVITNDETCFHQKVEIDHKCDDDTGRRTSPVLNTKRMSPPLVFSLYTFEKFENLAHPIIEEHTDLQTAKNIINSQIIGSELFIPNHSDENNDRDAPVLNNIAYVSMNVDKNVKGKYTVQKDAKEAPNSPGIFDVVDNNELNSTQHKVCMKTQLKDEILFSSDEEDEYLHKKVQELPLTCALETSFYEKSDVLDRTMYVGFQTASNKSIQINTDSFSKAKSLFSTVVNDETSLEDLVEIFDSGIDKTVSFLGELRVPLTDQSKKDNFSNKENDSNKVFGKLNAAIDKIEEGIGDTFKSESLTALEHVGENNDDILISQVIPFKSIVTPKYNKGVSDLFEESVVFTKRKLEGFKTASNKKIKLSDKALARCKKVFQDINFDENFDDDNTTDDTNRDIRINDAITEIPESKIEDVKDLQINDRDILQEFEVNEMPFEKNIDIRDGSIAKAKNILSNIISISEESKTSTNMNKEDDNFFKKPKVLERVLNKPKQSMLNVKEYEPKNENDFTFTEPSTSKFIGFKTAANKEIEISSQALEKMKNFYKDIDEDVGTNVSNEDSGYAVEKHPKDILNTEDMFAEELFLNEDFFKDNIVESKDIDIPVFKGFQTANNKSITISEKALQMSKKLFEDITNTVNLHSEDPEVLQVEELSNDRHEIPKLKDVVENKEAIKTPEDTTVITNPLEIRNIRASNVQQDIPVFKGFQTASNKKVKISDEALAKGKKLLQDMIFSQTNGITTAFVDSNDVLMEKFDKNYDTSKFKSENSDLPTKFVGFRTASNKNVKISENALAKTRQIFTDIETNNEMYNDKLVESNFSGFKTANNKKVRISEEAMAKSNQMFSDFELNKDNLNFKTENNNEIKISENALAKSKQRLNDIDFKSDDLNDKPVESNFVGFKTANNKDIKLSEHALAKSRQMFNDFDLQNEGPDEKPELSKFVGFKTANNKKVKISDEALTKSKAIFKDINEDEKSIKIVEAKDKDSPVFKGFQTGSNKQVLISDKALEQSKKLFQDIEMYKNYENANTGNVDMKVFCGFQTASNKKVVISENALAKSRNVFEGIGLSQKIQVGDDFNISEKKNEEINAHATKCFKGFQTASNKKVVVSEQAIARTKTIFNEDFNEPIENTKAVTNVNSEKATKITKDKLLDDEVKYDKTNLSRDIIDTQVLNDFEDSPNTEDFCKSTPKSKRSGSPILSCPKAKKRRFEAPYRNDKKIQLTNSFVPPKLANTYQFNDVYKKNKVYTLKDLLKLEKDTKADIDTYITKFNFDTLLSFEFFGARNDYTEARFDVNQIKKLFLDSVNKKIVPDGWLDNHIKLIIWKLLSYEVKFPGVMRNVCSVKNVMEQLKYRYNKELYNVQRPVLRKILEKDDVPSKTMVLCVAAIYVDDISVTSVPTPASNIELLLTDGWYCLRAVIDRMLCQLVCNGSIVVGCKMATSNAELVGCEQGIAPWEDTSSVRLKLHGNSTRRAAWLCPLGARAGAVRCGLRARIAGGRGAAAAVVARTYPRLAVLRGEGGNVILSERLEQIRQMKQEAEQQALMEKLYEELEKELADQESQDMESYSDRSNCMDSGSQIFKMVKRSRDPEEYRTHLTASQNALLEEHNARKREKKMEEARVKFQEKLEKNGIKKDDIAHLLKVRLVDFNEKGSGVEVNKGYLSIWNPSAAVMDIMTEGAWVEIINFIPTGIRNSEIQLSAGRQTVFKPYEQKNQKYKLYANTLKRKCVELKDLAQNPNMSTDYDEIDTVGIIFQIEPSTKEFDEKKQNFQNVFLADAEKNMVCVNFWGGLKKFGFENVLDTGQIVTCVNLQKRAGNSRKSIPQYRVTEFTLITKTPKDKRASEMASELSDKLSKIKEKFCEDCVVLKNNYSIFKTRNVDVSPYRFGAYNMPRRLESPMSCDANLNLTGLDFESSFNTQMSPEQLLRKKRVKEKIEKLKMYGEPPPLSSMHIINKSKNASATYKSPLIQKDNVASSENTPHVASVASVGEEKLQNSPVGLNRTFVKRVNPVKLNFSNSVAIDNDLNDSIDHFGDDFDASPPLSLDSDVVL